MLLVRLPGSVTHARPPAPTSAFRAASKRAPVPLRLVAFRGGLGIELYEAQHLACFEVEELTWSLPGVGFPVDLSGGVRSFSRKRGLLQRLVLSVDLGELESWLSQRAADIPSLGALQRPVTLWPVRHGIGLGVCAERGALGFDLLWAPLGEEDAGFVVSNPRCAGQVAGPALSYVLGFLSHVLGEAGSGDGRRVSFGSVPQRVSRELLPKLGFRLPHVRGLRPSSLEVREERLTVAFDRSLPHWAAPPEVAGALEFAKSLQRGDRALTAGRVDEARQDYVAALESTPRHPELSQTIASIDAQFEERNEAALALLVESLPAVEFGLVGAQLLAKTGDFEGAKLAVGKLASRERFPPLAAAYWLTFGQWLPELEQRLEVVELALAASAGFVPARWARFSLRVHLGDVNGALADAEHVEAASVGSEARHTVLVKAAAELAGAGYSDAAGRLYERSLRYLPKDPESSLGVAQSFVEAGKCERAMVLLQRTVELAEAREPIRARANLALARLLADHVGDLPQAIHRARQVSGLSEEAVEARGYEAIWRAKIGDVAGASVAFSRLADTISASSGVKALRAAHWLLEAGRYFAQDAADVLVAERFLAEALRLAPKDSTIAEAYRAAARRVHVGRVQSGHLQASRSERPEQAASVHEPAVEAGPDSGIGALGAEDEHDEDAARNLELEVEGLKAQLLASRTPEPSLIDRLVDGLHRLRRDEEAYALLQAQIDDATGTARTTLLKALRKVLQGLIEAAREAGDSDDVELYELALERL